LRPLSIEGWSATVMGRSSLGVTLFELEHDD
jgi:hypothetical protein